MSVVNDSPARFGTDAAGLLCGYVFTPDVAGCAIDADEAATMLSEREALAGHSFLWLHFNSANQATHRWLAQRLSLPEAFYNELDHPTSTRVELAEHGLVAVLNDVTMNESGESTVSSMTLCVTKHLLVSARHTPLRSVDRLRASVKRGENFRSPVHLLAHLLRDQADVLVQIVRDATLSVDHIEDALIAGRIATTRPKLGALRRTLVRLQRLVAPEPAALFRLLTRPPSWMTPDDVMDLRSSAEELAAAVSDSVALVERMKLLQEELLAVLNERTGKTLFVLTVVTVLALPLTIIPGLFGMNVGGMPLRDDPSGFWILMAMLVTVSGVGAWIAFRRRRGD